MNLLGFVNKSLDLPTEEAAIPDKPSGLIVEENHYISGNRIVEPVPSHLKKAVFGMGCFWGAERLFWTLKGVYSTAVGYAGGITVNPTYDDVCSGRTGHTEVVLTFFDPSVVSYEDLLKVFWESHNPTQGMRQGNDVGTQYRSGIYYVNEQQKIAAERSREIYNDVLERKGYGKVTTEVLPLRDFYFAEDYHQQYLAKHPSGYCGIGGTGIDFSRTEEAI